MKRGLTCSQFLTYTEVLICSGVWQTETEFITRMARVYNVGFYGNETEIVVRDPLQHDRKPSFIAWRRPLTENQGQQRSIVLYSCDTLDCPLQLC